jgi:hypothetical protein
MSDFENLWSIPLVQALVDAGGTMPDVARAFEPGYGHISERMLSIAGYPALTYEQAQRLFEALHAMSDFAFSFSELDYSLLPFGAGKSLVERSGARRRGPYRRYRSFFSPSSLEFDENIFLVVENSRVFVIANGASEHSRKLYPAGAYVSIGHMGKQEMRAVGHPDILNPEKFVPIARMLDGRPDEDVKATIDTFSEAMESVQYERDNYQRWLMHPCGGLPHLTAFYRDRLKERKRRPFLTARYSKLARGHEDVLAWRKPGAETIDRLEHVCREYVPPSFREWKSKRAEFLTGEDIYRALLGDVYFLFTNLALSTSRRGDRVPMGWGLKPRVAFNSEETI